MLNKTSTYLFVSHYSITKSAHMNGHLEVLRYFKCVPTNLIQINFFPDPDPGCIIGWLHNWLVAGLVGCIIG